jgi:hypothetical protein
VPGSTVLRDEHTTWVSDDPHARAYQVLFGERSQRIARSLAADRDRPRPAHEDERCLACHTTPRPAAVLAATAWMNADGVGCESCHGASGRWLGPHTTIGWRDKTRPAKEELGLLNTKGLERRALVCTGCHVGRHSPGDDPIRDVNHDLIAAGHPRLIFELAAYLDNMPPHWEEKDENAGPADLSRKAADFPARAWIIGQLTTELASLELLRGRAADKETPWPEFSEHGCYSCHHDLRDQAWRRRSGAGGGPGRLGTPRWGAWTRPLSGLLIEDLVAGPVGRPCTESLDRLGGMMAKPVPDQEAVQRASREASGLLVACVKALPHEHVSAGQVRRLIERIDSRDAWDRVTTWDEAVQRYLTLVALRQSWSALEPARKADQDALKARLEALGRRLQFPDGFDSPRDFDPVTLGGGTALAR